MKPGRRHISPSAGAGPRVRCLELGLCLPSICNSFASSPQSSQSQQDHSQGRGFLTGRCSVFDFSGMHWHKPRGDSGFINTHRAPILPWELPPACDLLDRAVGSSRSRHSPGPRTAACPVGHRGTVQDQHPVQQNRSWAKRKQARGPWQITQGSCAWCRNPEGSSGTGENRNEDSSSTARRAGGAMVSGAGLSSLSWRALRHWMKMKAGTCPSTFLLSFLTLCTSPEITQHQGAQKWEQHSMSHCPQARPQGNIQTRAVLRLTAGLCTGQGPLNRQSKGIPSSWRGNHRKKLRLAPWTFEQLHPHSPSSQPPAHQTLASAP